MLYSIPSQVNKVISLLNEAGFSAYVVGGAVRDLVMEKIPHDWDITTSAKPEETKKVFESFRLIETGIKHGTVTVLADSMPLEITTYRTEGDYSDRRRPDSVFFTDNILDDLSRRDFTCNALAYHPKTGIINEFNGLEDIESNLIRCVGNPDTRFNEDALRIMRALRFASVLGFDIDKDTADSIRSNYTLLKYISEERIFSELIKLLCGKNAGKILREFSEVFFFLMPELSPMKGCEQRHERHIYDVWEHSVTALENIKPDGATRMAMLLHDSGKPSVKSEDEKGVNHFYDHAAVSGEIANEILIRFKSSNSFRREVVNLVRYHDFLPHLISKKTYKRYIGTLGLDTVKKLFDVREADLRAQNPAFLPESLASNEAGKKILDEIITDEPCFSIKDLAVDGRDLMKLGFEASHALGTALEKLLDEVMEGKIKNEKSALIARAKELL